MASFVLVKRFREETPQPWKGCPGFYVLGEDGFSVCWKLIVVDDFLMTDELKIIKQF
jgi:hypothetical protein